MSGRACRATHGTRFIHAARALAWWETGRADMLAAIEIAVRELHRDEAQRVELVEVLSSIAE